MTQNIANRRNPESREVPEGGQWGRKVVREGGRVIDVWTFATEGPRSAIGVGSGVCRPSELASLGVVFLYPSGWPTSPFDGGLGALTVKPSPVSSVTLLRMERAGPSGEDSEVVVVLVVVRICWRNADGGETRML